MIIRRETKSGSKDLNVVYRPCKVDEMLGNETNKKILKNALDTDTVPHTQLFVGDAGCGKTTAAKILALGLNCKKGVSSEPCLECKSCRAIMEGNSIDIREINVGQSNGKAYVDSVVGSLSLAPFNERYKVIIFDEAHELTQAAKDLLLKPIETGYSHVYFIFCTNQSDKLMNKTKKGGEAFLSRCSILNFSRVQKNEIKELLKNICEFEGFPYKEPILDIIAEEAKGVPREAIVWLNQVATEGSWEMVAAKTICNILGAEEDANTIELCRALNKGSFKEAIEVYGKIKNMPVESLRIVLAGYFTACLKRSKRVGDARKYSGVLDVLTIPIYDQGKTAEYKFFNYMFKVTDVINEYTRRK